MSKSRSQKSAGKKASLVGRIKYAISSRTKKDDPGSRVGSGGQRRNRNIMDAVDKAQTGK